MGIRLEGRLDLSEDRNVEVIASNSLGISFASGVQSDLMNSVSGDQGVSLSRPAKKDLV